MKIAIVGVGNAGRILTAKLCDMEQDVVMIDKDRSALAELALDHDIMTIEGGGEDPDVYLNPSVQDADLLAAVTPFDEINLLSCCWGKAAGARYTIARLSDDKYLRSPIVDTAKLGVDLPLVHKQECTREVFDVLFRPGTLEVSSLLDDKITALGLKLPAHTPIAGKPLKEFKTVSWLEKVRIIGRIQQGRLRIPNGNSVMGVSDEIYVVVPTHEIDPFLDWIMAGQRKGFKKVVIAGAGEFGLALAGLLEDTPMKTILIDNHRERAKHASRELTRCLVLNADATDASTLKEAGLDTRTAFVAITGDEEMNIVCCIQAKQFGTGFTIARIDKPEYAPIIANLNLLDRVVSPNISLVESILKYVRGETVEDVGLFHRITGEVQEVVIKAGSKGDGTSISNLHLPAHCIIAGVRRGDDVFVATGNLILRPGDHLAIYSLPDTAEKIQDAF